MRVITNKDADLYVLIPNNSQDIRSTKTRKQGAGEHAHYIPICVCVCVCVKDMFAFVQSTSRSMHKKLVCLQRGVGVRGGRETDFCLCVIRYILYFGQYCSLCERFPCPGMRHGRVSRQPQGWAGFSALMSDPLLSFIHSVVFGVQSSPDPCPRGASDPAGETDEARRRQ